jgi:hypothetical protein
MIFLLAAACTSLAGGEVAGTGVLTGAVAIGPICPVEQEGVPCPVPPETYAGVRVLVQSASTARTVERVTLDDEGRYRVVLPSGTYRVGLEHSLGIDRGNPQTRIVRVEAGTTVVSDFQIDTGIR